jgi:hypothetical protein
MSILRRSLLLGAAACVVAVGTVVATSAYAATDPKAGRLTLNDKGVLVFTAGAGVANDVMTGGTLDPILVVTDAAAKIKVDQTAAKMCKSITDRGVVVQQPTKQVRCTGTPGQNVNVVVHLGDRDDRHVALAAYPDPPELKKVGYIAVTVHGGAGGDQLDGTSSSAPVAFYGQDGRDLMAGGAHNDLLDAGTTVGGRQEVIGNGGKDTCKGASIDVSSCEL